MQNNEKRTKARSLQTTVLNHLKEEKQYYRPRIAKIPVPGKLLGEITSRETLTVW